MPKHKDNLLDSNIYVSGDSLNISPQRINISDSSVKVRKNSFSNQFTDESKEKTLLHSRQSTKPKISSKFGSISNSSFTLSNDKRNGSDIIFKQNSRKLSHSIFQPLTARSESSEEFDAEIKKAKKYLHNTSLTSEQRNEKINSFLSDEASSIAENLSVVSGTDRSAKNFRVHDSADSLVSVNGILFKKRTELKSVNDLNGVRVYSQSEIDAARRIQKWIKKRLTKIKKGQLLKNESQTNILKDGSSHSLKFEIRKNKRKDSRSLQGIESKEFLKTEPLVKRDLALKENKYSDVSKRVSNKYAWLTQLENMSSSSDKSNEQMDGREENENNEYLSRDKFNSVINYLQSMKTSDEVLGSLDGGLNEKKGKFSTRHSEPIEKLSKSISNVGSKDKESRTAQSGKVVEESKINNFKLEEKKYKETISRHLKFIDQLIGDKKHLTETLEDLQNKCKNLTLQFQKEVKTKEESHAIELKKLKDIHAAAEQIKRERWIKTEANRIKELTAKGFEPALQKLISNHKSKIDQLKNEHLQEMAAAKERATEEMRRKEEQFIKEMEEAVLKTREDERKICEEGFKRVLSQEHGKFSKEKQRLEEIINKTREEMKRVTEKHGEEFEMLKRNMEDAHSTARNVLKREYEDARREMEIRHEAEIKDIIKQHGLEKNSWEAEFWMKHREEFSVKEKEMREKLKKERDREIELALEKLEDEHQAELEQVKKDAESQRRKLQEKHEKELKLIETTEESMCDKNNKLKSSLFEAKDEIEKLKSTLKQKDKTLLDVTKLLAKRNEERERLTDVIRQEVADKMASTESENNELKQQICNMKARHNTEIKKAKSDALMAIKLKDEEVQEIHRRVKDVLSKRAKVEDDLRKERDAATTRADYIQQLLIDKKEGASVKNKTISKLQ